MISLFLSGLALATANLRWGQAYSQFLSVCLPPSPFIFPVSINTHIPFLCVSFPIPLLPDIWWGLSPQWCPWPAQGPHNLCLTKGLPPWVLHALNFSNCQKLTSYESLRSCWMAWRFSFFHCWIANVVSSSSGPRKDYTRQLVLIYNGMYKYGGACVEMSECFGTSWQWPMPRVPPKVPSLALGTQPCSGTLADLPMDQQL